MSREELCLNRGWLFFDKEITTEEMIAHKSAYIHAKTRSGAGASLPDYDDFKWMTINLPHDFVVGRCPQPDVPTYCGCRKRGVVWYRRYFRLEEEDRGKNIELDFGAIASSATVFFNGAPVYENSCGYTGFKCDVTPMAEYGDYLNTIAVRVDASACEGWWYEGGGIYRDVWLIKRNALHVETDGVYANPVKNASGEWHIPYEASVMNSGENEKRFTLCVKILDKNGVELSTTLSKPVSAPVFLTTRVDLDIPILFPVELWDINNPYLYTVQTILLDENGTILDETSQKCGFRTIKFTAQNGFFLNERNIKLKGTCNHQDHAGVGVAVPKSLERYRLLKLKEMGCNAYRCSHNPPSSSLLDLCDELGILVMDENRHYSTSEEHLNQLRWLVKRDRNHPSVILWSIFNEEPLQCNEVGYQMARKMCAVIHQLDTTRFTTGAMNGGFLTPLNASMALDVTGINYYIYEYDHYHEIAPNQPVVSTEDTSAVTSRGELFTDRAAHHLADNDTEAVPWGATQRVAWKAIDERPWMSGGFAWTGFDYKGEPTPYPYPSNSSFFGILDICGFPKNSFYVRQAFWRDDLAVLKIATHWNRTEMTGTPVPVMVISSKADEVELFLNGRSLGRQITDKYEMNTFDVAYEPGELKAVSYKNGVPLCVAKECTTEKPFAIELVPDRSSIADDGYDIVPVAVYVKDKNGNRVPDAHNFISFSIEGEGEIAGVGNGDENSSESDTASCRSLYNGAAMVFIRTKIGGRGNLVLSASGIGLQTASVNLAIVPDGADRKYAAVPHKYSLIKEWLQSPFYDKKPNALLKFDDNDMNSWQRTETGHTLKSTNEKPYVMLRAELPENKKNDGIVFRSILGRAEFYYGENLIAVKDSVEPEQFNLKLPAVSNNNTLTVLLEIDHVGLYCGILGLVLI